MSVARLTEHIRHRAAEWPPSSSRLEVGTEALAVLRNAIPPVEPSPYAPSGVSPIGLITGLPIVEDAELDPLAWRLIDHQGQVMDSGTFSTGEGEDERMSEPQAIAPHTWTRIIGTHLDVHVKADGASFLEVEHVELELGGELVPHVIVTASYQNLVGATRLPKVGLRIDREASQATGGTIPGHRPSNDPAAAHE